MCGRYLIYTKKEALEERFGATLNAGDLKAHYNASPSQNLPVVLSSSPEEIVLSRWGFIPHWAKAGSSIKPIINARSETILEKRLFADSFKKRRCLILADGFYEWKNDGKTKTPYHIKMKDSKPFAFAGIWDNAPESSPFQTSFSIITTRPNGLLSEIHNRMPVILKKEDEVKWVDEGLKESEAVTLLDTFNEKLMEVYKVSRKINSPSHNTPEAIIANAS